MSIFGRKSTAAGDTATTTSVAAAVSPDLAALTGDYTIDPSHTTIGFVARHAMVTNVKGSFQEFEGTLHLDGTDPAASTASLDIKMDSIETGSADRAGHLKSSDFFRTDEFPTMTFRSTKAESPAATTTASPATWRSSAPPGRSPSTWSSTARRRTRSATSAWASRARRRSCARSGA
jgi:polyisoprenoid-binding protein YceI